jgi:hypothetical protein
MYVVTLDDLRMDCIHAACPPTLPGPGTHDAGLFRILQPFLLHRVQGLPLPQALAQRGTYDGSSGYYEPSDVATVEQALGGVFVFGWQLDWGHDGAGGVHGKPFDMPAGIARITVDAEWTCRDDCALRLVTGKAGVSSLATTGVGRARLVVDQPEPGPWSISLSPEGVTSDVRGLVRYSLDPA